MKDESSCSEGRLPAGLGQRAPAPRSMYRGIEWDSRLEKWRARITISGKKISLGSFSNPELAGL